MEKRGKNEGKGKIKNWKKEKWEGERKGEKKWEVWKQENGKKWGKKGKMV